jgi:tRNA(Ile)-lysidine synthase
MSFSAAQLRAVLEVHVPAGSSGLVVALSGGADSTALLCSLSGAAGVVQARPVRAVHIDHGLQEASAQFRATCQALCARLQIPLTIIRVNVDSAAGVSIEEAARDARYAALARELNPQECLLTAHHRKDQAETLLLQAMRGAGVKGLSAMPICRSFGAGWHVRPLLNVTPGELKQLCAPFLGATPDDPMNEDLRFDRAYVRKLVWPLLEERWPGVESALSRSAAHMRDAQCLLDAAGAALLTHLRDGDALSVPGLRVLPPLQRVNAVRAWLSEAGAEPPSAARLAEALRQVLDADADQLPVIVWGGLALRRYRSRVFLTAAHLPRMADERPLHAASGAYVDLAPGLGKLRLVAQIGGIEAAALPLELSVRRRDGGEELKPARQAKTQSLQHLCQSQGVLPWMRDALPLIFAGDALIAVGDLWIDARWCAAAGAPGLGVSWENAPIIV